MPRLRAALRDFLPAALKAFGDLDASDTLELLAKALDSDRAAHLSRAKIAAALTRANRRGAQAKAMQVQTILRAGQLRQPTLVQSAYATIVSAEVALIASLNT